jgi:hypothetical protein
MILESAECGSAQHGSAIDNFFVCWHAFLLDYREMSAFSLVRLELQIVYIIYLQNVTK